MSRVNPFVILAAGLLLCMASLAVSAADIVGVTRDVIRLETGKGVLIRLDRAARTVFVADPNIADVQVKSPRLIYLFGKRPGGTSLFAVDANERVLLNRPVIISHDLSQLRKNLKELLPEAAIKVASVNGTLVLSGAVATAREAEDAKRMARRMVEKETDIVNRIQVTAPNQVHLKVRIAEVSRNVLKEFGISWEGIASNSGIIFGAGIGRDFIDGSGNVPRTDSSSLLLRRTTSNIDFAGIIDALERQGLITILAEPSLTAVSGEAASFLAGGEFPILSTDDKGRIYSEFKPFGVALSFTPTLVGQGRISLAVAPEVSKLSSEGAVEIQGFKVPSLTVRRATTTVELGSGQSFAIAGLLQNDLNHDIEKFPGLADLPILGPLFRSSKFQRDETELVILVTPYIVRPVSAARMTTPTDGLTPPTDMDRVFNGRLYRPSLNRRRQVPAGQGGNGLTGPSGFILN